jgi:hypothetical protein
MKPQMASWHLGMYQGARQAINFLVWVPTPMAKRKTPRELVLDLISVRIWLKTPRPRQDWRWPMASMGGRLGPRPGGGQNRASSLLVGAKKDSMLARNESETSERMWVDPSPSHLVSIVADRRSLDSIAQSACLLRQRTPYRLPSL